MKNSYIRALVPLFILTIGVGAFGVNTPRAHATIVNWERGASIWPNSSTDYSSDQYKQSLQNLKKDGANYVNLVIPVYQSNIYSTDIQAGSNTPTDQSLIAGIQYAHSIGLHVMLSLYLNPYDGTWRALINPSDRSAWYQNYGTMLVKYATIAQQQGVEQFCLGAELTSMASANINADNTERWQKMIAQVRAVYNGKLVYDANRDLNGSNTQYDGANSIQFWNNLDYIGISAYYPLAGDNSVANLLSQWQVPAQQDVQPLSQKWGKPVLFTEVGYRSVTNAHNAPWDSWTQGSYDSQEQVNDYTALFQFWNQQPEMQGVFLWWWSPNPNYGGSGNTDYTPQNKPAEQVLQQYWNSGSSGGDGTPPGTTLFSVSGGMSPSAPSAGQPVTLSTTVTNTDGGVSGANVDLEVYQGGSRVFQKVFSGQNFNSSESHTYFATWTPSGAGTYTVKVGIFSGDWGTLYDWNDSVASVSVQSGSSGSSGSYTTDIWWPTSGARVSGVQPFKAMLEGLSTSQYTMYWQVDSGQLNAMSNSTQDYPHKEALVDLSGWKWHGTGPYTINFVSKNSSNAALSQKSVQIYTP